MSAPLGVTRRTSTLSICYSFSSPPARRFMRSQISTHGQKRLNARRLACGKGLALDDVFRAQLEANLNFPLGGHCSDGTLDTYLTRVADEYTSITHRLIVHSPCTVPLGFYIPSTCNIHSDEELATIGRVTSDEAGFSKSVAQANNELEVGYKRIRNEFCAPTP